MNIAKKQWMAPVATEIEVNNGAQAGSPESTVATDGNS
tara:strand:+ start:1377 stop:1490 length:114 start_codon:yes stop_codon:yes gene_type:complete